MLGHKEKGLFWGTRELFSFLNETANYTVCPIEPGERITLTVSSYDGNKLGMFCSVDSNASFGFAGTEDSAKFIVYEFFYGMGSVVVLLIMVGIIMYFSFIGVFKAIGGMNR